MENFHLIEVRHFWSKRHDMPMVRVRSNRFKSTIFIPYDNEAGSGSPSLETAAKWLKFNGFDLIGQGETKDDYTLISTTFKSLK